ncbi:MAG: prepilin peptidase, partial [Nanoarchaeota archaeon]|nr:prepilin peptidase [Nanoarchaeota archaeon]
MVIYGFIVLFLIILSFILASIEDIKKREVYDYLNYTLTFFILVLGLFHSFATNSIDPIKYVSFGILIGFILGSFLYYIGIWGGGDAKFLIGFSAASYYLISYSNFDTKMTFFLDYFIN